jgi:hypothetical protein
MTLRFDHAIIAVFDLESAMRDYAAAGFDVFYGGKHAGGYTHNALVVLADGSYLELLAPTDKALLQNPPSAPSFLFIFERGEGLAGFALLSDNIEPDVDRLGAEKAREGARTRHDGQRIAWKMALINGGVTPFIIQDLTPRVLRVPDEHLKHSNGVVGTAGLALAVRDLQAATSRYQTILDLTPRQNTAGVDFALDGFTLSLESAPNAARAEVLSRLRLVTTDSSKVMHIGGVTLEFVLR